MKLYEVIWKEQFVEKIESKHGLNTNEVEEVLFTKPHIRRIEKGRVKREDLYVAYGQTEAGRYVAVFFIHKQPQSALPISAREMSSSEMRYYEKQKEAN